MCTCFNNAQMNFWRDLLIPCQIKMMYHNVSGFSFSSSALLCAKVKIGTYVRVSPTLRELASCDCPSFFFFFFKKSEQITILAF